MVEGGVDELPLSGARCDAPPVPLPRVARRFVPLQMTFESDLESHLLTHKRFPDRELRDTVVLCDDRAAEKDREKDKTFHLHLRGPIEQIVPHLQFMCVA